MNQAQITLIKNQLFSGINDIVDSSRHDYHNFNIPLLEIGEIVNLAIENSDFWEIAEEVINNNWLQATDELLLLFREYALTHPRLQTF